jgi:hypothetical protein
MLAIPEPNGGPTVIHTVAAVYSTAWLLTAVAFYVEGRRLRSDRTPPDHPLVMSILAGAVWPLMLLGLVELGALAATEKVVHDEGLGLTVLA